MKVSVPFFRTGYNYDRDAASDEVALFCPPEEGMTQQQFAEEVDINTIVRRFGLTGELPQNPRPPLIGDFSGITDFKSAMDAVVNAQEGFMEFPAELRAKFDNDPQRMLEFVSDAKNKDKALEMGLIAPAPEKPRDVVQAVDELKAVLTPKAS